jgi:hypothetical protein
MVAFPNKADDSSASQAAVVDPIQWNRVDRSKIEAVALEDADDEWKFWLSRTPEERWAGIEHLRRTYHGDAAIDARLPRLLELVELGEG